MKIIKNILIVFLLFSCIFFVGCKDKNLTQMPIMQDIYKTGGNLTFNYDEISHVATFGGEGEVIQYYQKDIAKGWIEEGCRVGFMIMVPKNVKDYKSGKANLNGKEIMLEKCVDLQEGQTLVATFQPIVTENENNLSLKIQWEDGKNEQIYHIIIKKGTIFMKNNAQNS